MGAFKDVPLFDLEDTEPLPAVAPAASEPAAAPAALQQGGAPDPADEIKRLKRELTAKEAECNKLAWLSAMQSSAACGHLKPFHPYEDKPLAPIEEVLRLQRVIELMKDGSSYEVAKGTAAREIPIHYTSKAPE